MSWNWRKSFNLGPVRTSVSKNGVGTSIGFLGFRVGVNPDGKKYVSFGLPGTGIYYRKNLRK
jgi:Protein of unknown function (DUF4236)